MYRQDINKLFIEYKQLIKKLSNCVKFRYNSYYIDIDDLIQAGFLGLNEANKKYKKQEGKAFKNYAYMRIKGAIIDEARKISQYRRISKEKILKQNKMYEIDYNQEIKNKQVDIINNIETNQKIEILKKSIKKVKGKYKIILWLYYIENMSYKNISNFLNIDLQSLAGMIFNAKKRLKDIIDVMKN